MWRCVVPPENRAVSGILGYTGVLQQSGPGGAETPRGLTPEGLVPMPPHDSADVAIRVPIHSRKHPNLFALVDPEDAELVNQYRWNLRVDGRSMYAQAAINDPETGLRRDKQGHQHFVTMHRLILNLSPGEPGGDHVNHNGLDNRRANLRVATTQENAFNKRGNSKATSRFKGVCWDKERGKWRAKFQFHGRAYYIGLFDDEIEAALAYDVAARELFGDFANPNFPEQENGQ